MIAADLPHEHDPDHLRGLIATSPIGSDHLAMTSTNLPERRVENETTVEEQLHQFPPISIGMFQVKSLTSLSSASILLQTHLL
jgi:hypothetical protein